MYLYIRATRIKGFDLYAVMLGDTVLGTAWSKNGARTLANTLVRRVQNADKDNG